MDLPLTVFQQGLLNNKTAIITGGGSGIGFAIAKELAYLGCTVIIGSRKIKRLKASSDKINAMIQSLNQSNKCIPIQLNVRSSKSIKEFFDKILNGYNISTIDYLVNNAGGQYPSLLHDIKEKGWKTVIDLNLNGIFLMSNYIFNNLWKNRTNMDNEKSIINITANSFVGMPTMGHSSAARAGVENLTMTMTQNWSKYNIRINAVAPGFINSSGLDTYSKHLKKMIMAHAKDNYLYRIGTCEEVSNAVVFLLSKGASFATGISLRVDGGESIYNPLLPPQKPLSKL